MNKAFLIGRVTADLTLSKLNSGHCYCRFSIAVNRPYARENDPKTDFITVVAWDKTAQNCNKYLSKGSQLAVIGSIQTGSYERDGIKRQTFEIRADQVEFLSKANTTNADSADTKQVSKDVAIDDLKEVDDDDMPF